MAGDTNEDGTDTTSIKPVSSLRSRFENLNNSDNAAIKTPSTPTRSASRLSQHFGNDTTPSKVSLDIQRPSTVHAAPPVQAEGNALRPAAALQLPLPTLRTQNGPRPPRPMSVGPSSPPMTPALTVQSPQSPPRPAFSGGGFHPGEASPPRPRSTGALAQALANPPVIPSDTKPLVRPKSPIGKPAKPPPPVNRAAKPVLGGAAAAAAATTAATATTTSTPLHLQTSLAPKVSKIEDDSVSPFNTPPDSPASNGSPRKASPKKSGMGAGGGGYFPPPPVHHQVQARRHFQPAVSGSSSGKDPWRDTSDDPERRPSLPARNVPAEPLRPTTSTPQRTVPDRVKIVAADPPALHSPKPQRPPDSTKPPVPEPRRTVSRSQAPPPPPPPSTSNRATAPPPRPAEASKDGRRPPATQDFLPPPKRVISSNGSQPMEPKAPPTTFSEMLPPPGMKPRRDLSPAQQQIRRTDTDESELSDAFVQDKNPGEYPDITQVNRRPPKSKVGLDRIWTHYDTRLFDVCGKHVCTSGYITRAWDVQTGKQILDMAREEREVKVVSMAWKPGASAEEEGQTVWLGDNYGEIQEVSLEYRQVMNTRPGAHGRHDVVKMHRYQNTIWSIDAEGKLLVWLPDEKGVPNLDISPNSHRLAKGHTFSLVARDLLWFAAGKEIQVYDPSSGHERSFHVTSRALSQPGTGEITSGATLPTQLDRVYFGHSDGKVSIYSTDNYQCISMINVSNYKITTLAGVGPYIWAGFSTGSIYVYDMKTKPWRAKKEFKAHDNPVANIMVDRSSVWKFGQLQVASIGLDNAIRFWDGMLGDDWMENQMHERDVEFCDFREVKAVIVTWNAGAATPLDVRHDQKDENFFREVIQPDSPPDILVFGFQELVDLEDKGLTAKNLFKGRGKSKANQNPEHMGHQYRAWKDYLARNLEDNMPLDETYSLVQTGNLVGLFSCIFVKSSLKSRIRETHIAEVKRGMGGLYGNKGAIIIRFVMDSTSLCFVNCHLAAGQKETLSRNNDATAILEASALEQVRDQTRRLDAYIGGGDGTMIMDHEICILNGDLNYRIDTMGRDSVVKTIQAGNLERLLERDQLLLSKRRNPAFKLRNFREERITFAPTYKYDVRSDRYDSSEKHRSPAWCDRILYRGAGRVRMLDYRRHECRASDHRPVSGTFAMRVKRVDPDRREAVWQETQARLVEMKHGVAESIRLDYLVNVLGVDPTEARKLVKK